MPSAREYCYQLDVCVAPRFRVLKVTEFGGDEVMGVEPP